MQGEMHMPIIYKLPYKTIYWWHTLEIGMLSGLLRYYPRGAGGKGGPASHMDKTTEANTNVLVTFRNLQYLSILEGYLMHFQ
jgi:hypothetical protein